MDTPTRQMSSLCDESNLLNVNSVVVFVSPDKPDEKPLFIVVDFNNQAVAIAFYVENYPVVPEYTCIRITPLDIGRRSPYGCPCHKVPCFQSLFSIGISPFPEVTESTLDINPHEGQYMTVPLGEQGFSVGLVFGVTFG